MTEQKRKFISIILLSFVLSLSNIAVTAQPVTLKGKVVSLAPNVTEILYELGLGDRVAAVSAYCNYPPEVVEKPKIGGMSNPSLEAIVALKPDMVVLTDDGNPRIIAERLIQLKIPVHVFRAKRLADLPDAIRALGAALGAKDRADQSARKIERAINQHNETFYHGPPKPKHKVLFVLQPEPLMVAGPGTAIDDVLTLLGLENIAADAPTAYPRFSLEEVIRRKPDVLFVVRSRDGMGDRTAPLLERLKHLEAVRRGRVCYVSDPLLRMGPRLIQGIDEIARHLEAI